MAQELALTARRNMLQPPSRLKKVREVIRRDKYLYLMALPVVAYFVIFKYAPMYGILIAFKDYYIRMGIIGSPWLPNFGMANFIDFFQGPYFVRLLKNTFLLNFFGLMFGFPIPIIFALLLNELKNVFFKKFIQTVSYLPHFLSTMVVIGLMFFLLSPNNGVVNQILVHFGKQSVFFMGESSWFRTLYVGSGIWQGFGWGAIIYISAISAIDPQLYEASEIDGAGRFKRAVHITIPGILPTVQIMLIFAVAGMMGSGVEKVLAMYDPSMYDVSDVIGTFVYRRGIASSDFSYATAVDLFTSVMNFILLVSANWISRKLNDNGIF